MAEGCSLVVDDRGRSRVQLDATGGSQLLIDRGPDQRVGEPDVPQAVVAKWSSGTPTIAPSGATFVSGTQWGIWNGALAVAVLKAQQLRVFFVNAAGNITGSNSSKGTTPGSSWKSKSPALPLLTQSPHSVMSWGLTNEETMNQGLVLLSWSSCRMSF